MQPVHLWCFNFGQKVELSGTCEPALSTHVLLGLLILTLGNNGVMKTLRLDVTIEKSTVM